MEKELTNKLKQTVPYFQNMSTIENVSLGGNHLTNLRYRSPFVEDQNNGLPFLPSDHVSCKQGTGLVHIAPALGHDDFKIGLKHGLENKCVIDAQGKYTDDDPSLGRLQLADHNVLSQSTTENIKVT